MNNYIMIDVGQDIHPLSDFKRRTAEFVRKLRQSGRPMVLTLNGRPEVVVLDARAYQNLINQLPHPQAVPSTTITARKTQAV